MRRLLSVLLLLLIARPGFAVDLPSDWSHSQQIDVKQNGIVRLSLPDETVDQADATLRDLRLFDPNAMEVPYLLEYPRREAQQIIAVKHFEVAIEKEQTRLTVLTGSEDPIEGVTLQTPASDAVDLPFIERIYLPGEAHLRLSLPSKNVLLSEIELITYDIALVADALLSAKDSLPDWIRRSCCWVRNELNNDDTS